ncbi:MULTISPECIES: lysophospholipid acyltransferase family protein [unclassified Mycobacterium]|uniref:lysophospholipid acyltransferase family protein n=1 Tax=unclassified Mycobacterium TaxID=2642494 RepID=UPI0007FCAD5E|nr:MULTISPECIES: lysophospholipid acyltransferase family protein [unclassified Mycobacterium]OBG66440.1 glycerol acyltransferase [Mycobacterium sp. E188]OBG67576.1 glycerol acyltransferase [Mycobacterium sp. E735]OBG73986.1 glycerol acyltransferase [Mycobacterium sp. E3305]OBG93649.1 glycerol acyltransferase [Mycobacterium sp. E3298]OBH13664.1 glycerol acyltransferase [Mycobacterium sp. E1715]
MNDTHTDSTDVDKWDRDLTEHVVALTRPIVKRYFRSEVRGLDNLPEGPSLVVGNHSGGMLTFDLSVFAVDYYDTFGYDRPLYALAFDTIFSGPAAEFFRRTGVIRATRENAAKALASGAVVLVFPGGDYDVYRPTLQENVVNFDGRTGYITTALEADVPIVPAVSIGGQESQLFLTRGQWLARLLRLTKFERRFFRTNIMPVTFGFPFGLSVLAPVNMPLPTKIVTEVLRPIDLRHFGEAPDIKRLDAHVRWTMQKALKALAAQRHFPVIG